VLQCIPINSQRVKPLAICVLPPTLAPFLGNYPKIWANPVYLFELSRANQFAIVVGLEHLAPGPKALYNPMKMNPNIKRPKSGISFMCAGNQVGLKGHVSLLLSPVAVMKKSKFH